MKKIHINVNNNLSLKSENRTA